MAKTKIIFEKDIAKAYSDKVQEYMSNGWMIHPSSMSGSQGEIAKVDLTDGKDVIRIWLGRDSVSDESKEGKRSYNMYDVIKLRVDLHEGKATKGIQGYDTIWNGNGQEIESKVWFIVNRYSRNVYVETVEEIKNVIHVQMDRYRRDSSKPNYKSMTKITLKNDEIRTKIRDMVRKNKGYGRVKKAQIYKAIVYHYSNGIRMEVFFTDDYGKAPCSIKKQF